VTESPAVASSLAGSQDTIVALSTPPGRSAIAVVRMSGLHAFQIAERLVTPWPLKFRRATLCKLADERSRLIDHCLVTAFLHPDSFTGEDTVEIATHGGHYVPVRLIQACLSSGARPAERGEFTRRAVLAGKLDITQAEAIGDLIDARSGAMHRAALEQLDGGLRHRIELLRTRLLTLQSLIAYDIDFPEEDDGPIARSRIAEESENLVKALGAMLATIPAGEMIREGATVVIAGQPNVGKSSLFNGLLGQSRAIVTEVPGTTRDAIEGFVESRTWPLRLVDTAGFRETQDTVEKMGIEVSERYLRQAHVILACGDSKDSIQHTLDAITGKTNGSVIQVRTKSDLGIEIDTSTAVKVSAATGEGFEELLSTIDEQLSITVGAAIVDAPVLTRTRHIYAIEQAREELLQFSSTWLEEHLPAPVAAVHLQSATLALESLIGAVSTDDVLDRVFSSFCVGK
jgi:tRNA modification GTPase